MSRKPIRKPTQRKVLPLEEILEIQEYNERREQEEGQIRLEAFKEALLLGQKPDGNEP
jgi:hypothetical protein